MLTFASDRRALLQRLMSQAAAVVATRYQGIIHDFVMLNALRGTNAADAAITNARAP
jgi:hypothetical protein